MPVPFALLSVASRPDPQSTDLTLQDGLSLNPGEGATILAINSEAAGYLLRIIAMGVTQHPKSTYTYNANGKTLVLAAPLGSFITPLYTCRDLGQHLDVDRQFSIAVTNNDTVPHKYAAQVIYQSLYGSAL